MERRRNRVVWTVHTRTPQKNATQMLFFSAATAKTLTTFLAGFAFTTITWPNISLLPAFVAGFVFSFSIARPGTVNFPADLTSFVPTAARLASAFLQSAAFKPVAAAIAVVKAL